MQPKAQSQYQVRFDIGVDSPLAGSDDLDLVVLIDTLGLNDRVPSAKVQIVQGGFSNPSAIAAWTLEAQSRANDRCTVLVLAVEGVSSEFAVENFLAAGAVIDSLASVGIDYCSPEAASACAAFLGLKCALTHLVSASTAGRSLAQNGEFFIERTELDRLTSVEVLRGID